MSDLDRKIIIIGASGHGKVIADIAELNGYENIVFFDDDTSISECNGYPVIGTTDDVDNTEGEVIVAIGNSDTRKRIYQRISRERWATLVHPSAVIARDVTIGDGTVVMAGVVINACSTIGEGCIVNTSSSVDHDCVVGDYVHIAVGSHLCGTVKVGNKTWIGAGAVVSNNISICDECIIGAGTVVVHNINDAGTYIGVPEKMIKSKSNTYVGVKTPLS